MKIIDNKLQCDEGDGFDFAFLPSPNVHPRPQSSERTLIIHTTEGPSVEAAVGTFMTKLNKNDPRSGLSIHLVLGRDGRRLVQMVSLERGASHAAEYNTRSIGIELDYPGDLRESGSKYRLRSSFREDQYILGSCLNSPHYRYWPLFPPQQLDALVRVSKALLEKAEYNLVDVAAHEELHSYKVDPGPAFPIVQFRERLGIKGRSIVLQETARDVRVRNAPGGGAVMFQKPVVPAGAPVTVINEFTDTDGQGYCLVSVIGEIEGDPWILGWVRREDVRVKTDQEFVVRDDHYLGTPLGSRFEVIPPHPDNYHKKDRVARHKYVIIHFTTGTRVESTIAHFRNAASQVSAHLLIGRDGRVIQFLPFDRIAFHAGSSWWERDRHLNYLSIGIELDNAGILKQSGGVWKRKHIPIAEADVQVLTHKREHRPRGWHTFTDVQLQVAERIVRALAEHYRRTEGVEMEILGHDDVNLANRLDPGPAFPMEEMRERLFGRREAPFRIYAMSREAKMYENFDGGVPNVRQRLHDFGRLPRGAKVEVLRTADRWSLVRVLRAKGDRKGTGWIRTNTLAIEAGKKGGRKGKRKDKEDKKGKKKQDKPRGTTNAVQDFYRRTESPPTPQLRLPRFEEDPRIRIEEVRGKWSLVVLLDYKHREGWIETRFITPDPTLDEI